MRPSSRCQSIIERRPDIRQAEQNLIAANAEIGVGKVNFFPQVSLTGSAGGSFGSQAALSLARILREVRAAIRSYDQDLETLTREHPDFALIDSLPGVGPALAPRLIAALGTQRDRY